MDKYDAMSDTELSAEAARFMGWREIGHIREIVPSDTGIICGGFPVSNRGGVVYKFDPINDLNHATEFGAAFLVVFPDTFIRIDSIREQVSVEIYEATTVDVCEPRARTLAILKAWTVLNG